MHDEEPQIDDGELLALLKSGMLTDEERDASHRIVDERHQPPAPAPQARKGRTGMFKGLLNWVDSLTDGPLQASGGGGAVSKGMLTDLYKAGAITKEARDLLPTFPAEMQPTMLRVELEKAAAAERAAYTGATAGSQGGQSFTATNKRVAFTAAERETIKSHLGKKQKGKCAGCGRKIPADLQEIDHIQPVSKGGGNELRNLQLLCATCNRRKGAKW